MVERLGEMRKGRRERIEKGSREKEKKESNKRELRRQFEEEGGPLKEIKEQWTSNTKNSQVDCMMKSFI